MKLTFLGTAAGLPRKNAKCSSAMLEVGGKYYVFDTGATVVNKLVDMDKTIEDIKAVFITHCHADHLLGIIDLIRCVNIPKIFTRASIDYYLPENSVINAIDDYFNTLMGGINKELNRIHNFTEGLVYSDENVKVSAIATAHMRILDRPSYAFAVECEGKRVLFSGDLSQHLKFDDFPKVAYTDQFDAIVCEGAHFDFETIAPVLKKCKTKTVYFNHMKQPNIPIVESENSSGDYPFQMVVVNDGDSFEF